VRGGGISLEDRFDVVSIQFAIHYMMSSRTRARRFFQTVSELLEVGGNLIATTIDARVVVQHLMNLGLDLHFDDDGTTKGKRPESNDDGDDDALIRVGNGACQIRFPMDKVRRIFAKRTNGNKDDLDDLFGLEYTFTLVEGSEHSRGVGDAVNLPEWLTPLPVLTSLAEEAGLVLEYAHNFHEFYAVRSDPKTHAASHGSLYNMKVLNRNGSIAPDEWEISRLYVAIKFRKVRESTMTLDDEVDNEDDGDDSEEDNDSQEDPAAAPSPELDPATKAKLLPMAMMKAKRSIGDEAWKSLSSDEKTRLTEAELRKLAAAT
jgi:mRNA (guanine-N7-)-methyltransferase